MKMSEDKIGCLVCLENSESRTTARVLNFHKGPINTDVDLELPNGEVINTFASNIVESDIIDIAKYQLLKALSLTTSKVG